MKRFLMFGIILLATFGTARSQDKLPVDCPKIIIEGPPAPVRPGVRVTFKAAVPGVDAAKIRYDWKVDSGTFNEPPDSSTITVLSSLDEEEMGGYLNATVRVTGLPFTCPNEQKATAIVVRNFHPDLVDEWRQLPKNDRRARLDAFLHYIMMDPQSNGYVVLYYRESAPKAVEKRINEIKDFIFGYRRFPRDRIVVLSEPSDLDGIKLYRIPKKLGAVFASDYTAH